MFKLTLEFTYKDAKTAESMLSSLKLDNEGYVESRVEGRKLVSVMKAETLASLRQTMEDFLACAQLAENVILGKAAEGSRPGGAGAKACIDEDADDEGGD